MANSKTSTTYGTAPNTQQSSTKPTEQTPVLDSDTQAPNQDKRR